MDKPIFISYSRKDKQNVFPFVQRIESELGVKCWIDRDGIQSGDAFRDIIIQAIDHSKVVLFMHSDNSRDSSFIKKEVDYAKNTGKKIIPIIVDGGKLKDWFLFEFGNIDYIDIGNKEHLDKLFKDLKILLNIKDVESAIKEEPDKEKVSIVVSDNKITLDITDNFSFVLEKDDKNKVFIGNIPVREILEDTKKGQGRVTSAYLKGTFAMAGISYPPILKGITNIYKLVKKNTILKKVESDAFNAILAEVNNRYNILLEKISDNIKNNTTFPVSDFAVFLDYSNLKNKNKSLKDKLKSIIDNEDTSFK